MTTSPFKKRWQVVGYGGPYGPPENRPIVSSIALEESGGHDIIHLWNRGGKAGHLVVSKGDGMTLINIIQAGYTKKFEEVEL